MRATLSTDIEKIPIEDRLPPLDVLMVLHSYLLNPWSFYEDTHRSLEVQPLLAYADAMSLELVCYLFPHQFCSQLTFGLQPKLPGILEAPPSEARIDLWSRRMPVPFDPIDSAKVMESKDIICPVCKRATSASETFLSVIFKIKKLSVYSSVYDL
jgi:hypothetical protein